MSHIQSQVFFHRRLAGSLSLGEQCSRYDPAIVNGFVRRGRPRLGTTDRGHVRASATGQGIITKKFAGITIL